MTKLSTIEGIGPAYAEKLTAAGVGSTESLLPLLRGEAPDAWRTSIYYRYYEVGIHAVQPHEGVRTERSKLIHFPELDEWELYDLVADPEEVHNLHGDPAHAELVARLTDELARLRERYGVPDA